MVAVALLDRGEPEDIDPEILDVIEFLLDPIDIAKAIAIAIGEAATMIW
jgi:hypothetical protein